MTNPRHLWSGDWREESARARQAAEEARARRLAGAQQDPTSSGPTRMGADADADAADAQGAPSPSTAPRRGRPRLTIVALVLVALVIGAFAIGNVTGGDDAPAPLPAVSGTPIKPKKGQT